MLGRYFQVPKRVWEHALSAAAAAASSDDDDAGAVHACSGPNPLDSHALVQSLRVIPEPCTLRSRASLAHASTGCRAESAVAPTVPLTQETALPLMAGSSQTNVHCPVEGGDGAMAVSRSSAQSTEEGEKDQLRADRTAEASTSADASLDGKRARSARQMPGFPGKHNCIHKVRSRFVVR